MRDAGLHQRFSYYFRSNLFNLDLFNYRQLYTNLDCYIQSQTAIYNLLESYINLEIYK